MYYWYVCAHLGNMYNPGSRKPLIQRLSRTRSRQRAVKRHSRLRKYRASFPMRHAFQSSGTARSSLLIIGARMKKVPTSRTNWGNLFLAVLLAATAISCGAGSPTSKTGQTASLALNAASLDFGSVASRQQ